MGRCRLTDEPEILGGARGRNETARNRTQVTFSLLQDLFKPFFEYIRQSVHPILTGQQSPQL